MNDTFNKKVIGGVITAGLLIIGLPPAIDIALVDTVSLQPIAQEASMWNEHIREFGNYTVEAKDFADRDSAVSYCAEGNCIRFTPASMSWDTGDELKSGPALLSNREVLEKKVKYESVYGTGIDLDVSIEPDRFSKVVTIDSLDTLGPIPDKAETLDVYFAIETNLMLSDGPIDSGYRLSKYSQIAAPQVWGSLGEKGEDAQNIQQIHAEIKTIGETQFLVKHIPVSFLQKATFPVHTDADIVYGTAYMFTATQIGSPYFTRMASIDTDQFVTCYYENSTTNVTHCVVGTVSAGVITYGATSSASTNDSYINNGSEPEIAVCKVDTDKFAVVYAADTLLDDGYVRIATVSGSTITFGTALEFLTTDMEAPGCTQIGTDKIAISYNNETNDQLEAKACTISGTTPTCGTANVIDTDTVDSTSISAMGTDKFVIGYTSVTALEFNVVVATVSGTTITDGTPTNLRTRAGDNGGDQIVAVGMGAERFAGMYNDNNGSFQWAYFVSTTTGTTINAVATSSTITQPTNGPDFGNIIAAGADTVIGLTHDFEGVSNNNKEYTRIGLIDWDPLSVTVRTRDMIESRTSGSYGIDIALLDNNYVVKCGMDALASPVGSGWCVTGSIRPQLDTYDATNVASTTVTMNGEVTQTFEETFTGGFVYGIDSVFTATTTTVSASSAPQTLTANLSGLTTFEEYGYSAFATTSIATIYDDDIFRFFTADISTSTPVVAADNHAWDLSTFAAGTHSTTATNTDATILSLANTSRQSGPFLVATSTHIVAGASTTVTLNLPSSTRNDLVIIYGANDVSSLQGTSWVTSAGWTTLVPDGNNNLPGYYVGYKLMGATPDTTFTIVDSGNTTRSSKYIVEVWRDVDIYQPIDNSYALTSSASGMPNSPSITTLMASSTVITVGFIDDVNAATATPPTGYTNFTVEGRDVAPDVAGATVMVASKQIVTPAAEDPAVFGGTDTDDWRAVTFAIRSQQNFGSSGSWIAPSWDVGSIGNVLASWIEFSSTTGDGTTVVVKTAVNTSATVPPVDGDFATSTSAGSIAGVSTSQDLTGKYLWIKIYLTPSGDAVYTPTFLQYIVGINESAAAAARRRIILPQ